MRRSGPPSSALTSRSDPGRRDHAEVAEGARAGLALRAAELIAILLDRDRQPRLGAMGLTPSILVAERSPFARRIEPERGPPAGDLGAEQQLATERAHAHLSVMPFGELGLYARDRHPQQVPRGLRRADLRLRLVDRGGLCADAQPDALDTRERRVDHTAAIADRLERARGSDRRTFLGLVCEHEPVERADVRSDTLRVDRDPRERPGAEQGQDVELPLDHVDGDVARAVLGLDLVQAVMDLERAVAALHERALSDPHRRAVARDPDQGDLDRLIRREPRLDREGPYARKPRLKQAR